MRGASRSGIFVVVLLAVGFSAAACSSTKHTVEAPTTTTPAGATTLAPTTTLATTAGGTDNASVLMRLQNVATAELTLYVNNQAFTKDPAALTSVEPGVTYGSGLTPPTNPVAVNVTISTDAQWACLTGKSASGDVFVLAVGPTESVYQGFSALPACDAAVATKLKVVTG